MSKAFTKEDDEPIDADSEEEIDEPEALPANFKNYMTPTGVAALQKELQQLMREERPKIVETVAWAAGNGDRSENGDYIYGKKRLREIDKRARYLSKRLESATVVDPAQQQGLTQVFFGARVTYLREDGSKQTVAIVGIDEADLTQGKISWLSPVAKALMKTKVGDTVELKTPGGEETIEVLAIAYPLA
jgi:transcription elongation factor GreB